MPALYWPSKKLIFLNNICTSKILKEILNFFPHLNCLKMSWLQIRFPISMHLLHPSRKLKAWWFAQYVTRIQIFSFFFFSFTGPLRKSRRKNGVTQSLKSECLPRIANVKDSFFCSSCYKSRRNCTWDIHKKLVLSSGELRKTQKCLQNSSDTRFPG